MSTPTRDGPFVPPDIFDGYRIERKLGAGTYGHVYLGVDEALKRRVAIKFLVQPSRSTRKRFVREGQALCLVKHENVVRVFTTGEANGCPYLVSEYVEGDNLHDKVKPIPWREALHIALDVAQGIEAAHGAHVLHRDISPANVILDRSGRARLVDFGLAKIPEAEPDESPGDEESGDPNRTAPDPAAGQDAAPADPVTQARLTLPGSRLGTPYYIAPEIWQGGQATEASDLFSIGAVLYELCCGEPPYGKVGNDELRRRAGESAIPSLRGRVGEDAPAFAAFADIVQRCLARDPDERLASATALLLDLRRVSDEAARIRPEDPYPGVRPFESADGPLFFGRDHEVKTVLEGLRRGPLMVVSGDSGIGKSSLCRAGVLPRVEHGALERTRFWSAILLPRPGTRPFSALLDKISELSHHLGRPAAGMEAARREPRDVVEVLRVLTGRDLGVLIVIDQLEELLDRREDEEQAKLAQVLERLMQAPGLPGVRTLVALRGDVYIQFFTTFALPVPEGAVALSRPTEEGLRQAIIEPARARRVSFASEKTVAELIDATNHGGGQLALLQVALRALWQARDEAGGAITPGALEDIGGVAGAWQRYTNGVVRGLPKLQEEAAEGILMELANPARGGAPKPGAGAEVQRAIVALVDSRLLFRQGERYLFANRLMRAQWEQARRWRWWWTRVAAACLLSVIVTGPVIWQQRHAEERRRIEMAAKVEEQRRVEERRRREMVQARRLKATISALTKGIELVVDDLRQDDPRQDAVIALTDTLQDDWPLRPPFMHGGAVRALAFSPKDPGKLASASDDGIARLWNAETGAQICQCRGHTGNVLDVTFSPDGRSLLTASADGTAAVWDAQTCGSIQSLTDHAKAIRAAAFSPDGTRVVTASDDQMARVFSVRDGGAPLARLAGHTGPVVTASYSDDGKYLLTASEDHTARLWLAESPSQSPRLYRVLQGHEGAIRSATFSHRRSDYVLTASDDRTARVWPLTSAQKDRCQQQVLVLRGHSGKLNTAVFSHDNRHIVTTSNALEAWLWTVEGILVRKLDGHTGPVVGASFSPDDGVIATLSRDSDVRLWDAGTGERIRAPLGHSDEVLAAAFAGTGERLATASKDGGVRIWDTRLGVAERIFTGHTGGVWSVQVSPDGSRIVSPSGDGTARVWDLATASSLPLREHDQKVHELVRAAIFSPDGRLVATGDYDKKVKLWDARTGELAHPTLEAHQGEVYSAGFSPDGRLLITGDKTGEVIRWSIEPGPPLQVKDHRRLALFPNGQQKGPIQFVVFAPQGPLPERFLTVGRDNFVQVWDRDGKPRFRLQHQTPVTSAAYSRDGKMIVTTSDAPPMEGVQAKGGTARLWDAQTGEALTPALDRDNGGHVADVQHAAFSQDGRLLVTGGSEGSVILWDTLKRSRISVLEGRIDDQLWYTQFSPDDKLILAVGGDSVVHLWDVKTHKALANMRGHTQTIFWATFLKDDRLVTASKDMTLRLFPGATKDFVKMACLRVRPFPEHYAQVTDDCASYLGP